MNIEEAISELHPLLQGDDFDATPVYPIIHMIRQVRTWYTPQSSVGHADAP